MGGLCNNCQGLPHEGMRNTQPEPSKQLFYFSRPTSWVCNIYYKLSKAAYETEND